ncbi:MAG: hypothetical protein DRR04_14865 [Gammaproteobacteria bacterium]|nr:MAG: hypothetical protein DRR04_14865 [Gammaproteobacteria bacterium]
MRADIWGMIAPGLPQVAAEYAKRDAMITHVRNGIYGEQYMAAAVSLAMVNTDVRTILEKALETIPAQSDYARAVKEIFACYDRGDSWEEAWQHIDDHYGWNDDGTRIGDFENPEYNTKKGRYVWANIRWVHVIPNGASCVLALLYGEGDFSESICIATMCGYDADCNAGTVGGIIGAMIGEKAIPYKWKGPLNDCFKTGVDHDFPKELKISEMAKEVVGYAKETIKQIQAE